MKVSKNLMNVVIKSVQMTTSQGQQDELGTSTNFLFGATSRYARAVLGEGRGGGGGPI